MTRTRLPSIALVVGALLSHAVARAAEPEVYAVDPVHTRVMVAVGHAGFSKALGTVSGSTGSVWFDPEDLAATRWDITVPLTRLDFGDAKWNAAVQAASALSRISSGAGPVSPPPTSTGSSATAWWVPITSCVA